MAGDGANLAEVFSSFQGEGFFAGRRQIFIRFAGCNLNCNYCDTPDSRMARETCRLEKVPASGVFEEIRNPVSHEVLGRIIDKLSTPDLHSISLTGGEPLLQADFIKDMAADVPLYLETNGTLPEGARKLAGRLKFAAVDIKLPEHDCGDWDEVYARELETIDILKYKCFTFAKVVVFSTTRPETITKLAADLAGVCPPIHLVIQPVTAVGDILPPSVTELMTLSEAAGRHLQNVQVLPQVHKTADGGWL
ncbi:MAG: 7-carboxy-7-deazaguanine synthase QueE [Euryarchaeota archaeon]|nr:7-carboxy-7-deazaguanine synthase QueE [Euryarchaeota archaeon]